MIVMWSGLVSQRFFAIICFTIGEFWCARRWCKSWSEHIKAFLAGTGLLYRSRKHRFGLLREFFPAMFACLLNMISLFPDWIMNEVISKRKTEISRTHKPRMSDTFLCVNGVAFPFIFDLNMTSTFPYWVTFPDYQAQPYEDWYAWMMRNKSDYFAICDVTPESTVRSNDCTFYLISFIKINLAEVAAWEW